MSNDKIIKLINESVQNINPAADSRGLIEYISGRLIQLESLVAVMDIDDFWDIDRMVLRNYVWAIQELISQSIETTEILFKKSN